MLSVTNSDSSHDIRQGRRLELRIGRVFGKGLKKYNSNDTRMFRSKRSMEDKEQTNSVCSTSRVSEHSDGCTLYCNSSGSKHLAGPSDICKNHRRQVWVSGRGMAPPRSGPWRGRGARQWNNGESCGMAGIHTNLYVTTKPQNDVN